MARILILKDEDLAGAGAAGRGRGRQAEGTAEQRPGAGGGAWTQGWEDGVDGSPGQDMAGGGWGGLIHHRGQRPQSGLCSPPVTLQWGGGAGKDR